LAAAAEAKRADVSGVRVVNVPSSLRTRAETSCRGGAGGGVAGFGAAET
jgi:hypothetical protein